MNRAPTIVWFRQDLRLRDNPALAAACALAGPVVPVYVWSPDDEGDWPLGPTARRRLRDSLKSLSTSLLARGSRLILRSGPAVEEILRLVRETGAEAVFWNRRYEPAAILTEKRVANALREERADARSFEAALLHDPERIRTDSGTPFKVFTPFWRALQSLPPPRPPEPAPERITSPDRLPESLLVSDLRLADFASAQPAGVAEAHRRLNRFLDGPADDYATLRDLPGVDGTSGLSPHLHFGEIGPSEVWHAAGLHRDAFRRQLAWREFAYHVLFHFPQTATEPMRGEFASFPWEDDRDRLQAWRHGLTGYPMVDAAMRQLLETGWMHNRARLVVGSFLVKDLRIPWQEGARWFWERLADADLANNTLGWQWVAGCGVDAAPYFRILNPVLQGLRFDPTGTYVRRWVPELAGLSDADVHQPWRAAPSALQQAAVRLGHDYPYPIVDHSEARSAALKAFAVMKNNGNT